jgi:formylglycine-generating enzyme required for sulfatase activity
VPQPGPERRHVFISYSHADRVWVERIRQVMAPLLRAGGLQVRLWDDSQIQPGDRWLEEIEAALASARVALLLVSAEFLASEFVMHEEVPRLLAAAEAEGMQVLWVSVSPCLVEYTPIHAYQAVLPPEPCLAEMGEVEQQRALITIGRALAAEVPRATPAPSSAAAPFAPTATPQILRWSTTTEVYWEKLDALALPLLRIPAGSFLMGSPETEPGRSSAEGPQQVVKLKEFLIGRTPITQAQWREVAVWQERKGERWGRELMPDPSWFQIREGKRRGEGRLLAREINSDGRPVEQVSWDDAIEFCNRLSQRTRRTYTLPSEAQWEYACRAGTTTPFAFGETITPQLANYNGNVSYVNGPKGEYRQQTIPVGMFSSNAWGLQDMHGNVREWCLDRWHDSYEGAPVDGSAWVSGGERTRLLRGGSWNSDPMSCRSAYRGHFLPVSALSYAGFRVVCLP